MSQQDGSFKAEVMSRHFTTLSRHCMRRALEETLELCRVMEMNIATKPRKKCKKNVATPDNSVATKNRENDRKILSRHMKREINEDTLKQCRNIKIDCRDMKDCKRNKFCHDTSKLSCDRS